MEAMEFFNCKGTGRVYIFLFLFSSLPSSHRAALYLACRPKWIKWLSIFGRRLCEEVQCAGPLILPDHAVPSECVAMSRPAFVVVVVLSHRGICCSQGPWTIAIPKTSILGLGEAEALCIAIYFKCLIKIS